MTVGDATFKQILGIPMCSAASSHLANIALFHNEKNFMLVNPHHPIQHSIFRYIDDFHVINYPQFITQYREIYPDYTGVSISPNVTPYNNEYMAVESIPVGIYTVTVVLGLVVSEDTFW